MDQSTEQEFVTTSPKPEPIESGEVLMDLPNAIRAVIEGKRITRLDWKNPGTYCLLRDGLLELFINGEYKTWTINDGDLLGTDWVIV